MSYSARNRGFSYTWKYLFKPLIKGKSLKSIFTPYKLIKKKKMKRTYDGKVRVGKPYGVMSSQASTANPSVGDKGADETSVTSITFRARVKPFIRPTHIDRALNRSHKFQHLYENSAYASSWTTAIGTSAHEALHTPSRVNTFLPAYDLLNKGPVPLVAATPADFGTTLYHRAVYLKSRYDTHYISNLRQTPVDIIIYECYPRCQDNSEDVTFETVLNDVSNMPPYASVGYDQDTFAAAAGATNPAFPRVPVTAPEFHWSQNRSFTTKYRVTKQRMVTLDHGAILKVNFIAHYNTLLTNDFVNGSWSYAPGQPLYFMKIRGKMSLGFTAMGVADKMAFAASELGLYLSSHTVGCAWTTASTSVPYSVFGLVDGSTNPEKTGVYLEDADDMKEDAELGI